jgi:hypothetical protein
LYYLTINKNSKFVKHQKAFLSTLQIKGKNKIAALKQLKQKLIFIEEIRK